MLFFNKSQKNNIKNRTIFLRHFPDTEEIQKMDAVKRMIWLKLDDIKFSRLGNVITISREQAESSKIMDIVSFVSEMSTEKNIEKIIYTVKNNKLDIIVTLWEEYIVYNKLISDLNGNKQLKPSSRIKSVIRIENKNNGKCYFSNNGTDDKGTDTVNGIIFPSCYILKNGMKVIRQLEADGTLPKSVMFKEGDDKLTMDEPQNDNRTIKITMFIKNKGAHYLTFDYKNYDVCFRKIINDIQSSNWNTISIPDLKEQSKILYINRENNIFSIGIIDEGNDIIYYYDNGSNDNHYVELNGETFPNYMTTSDDKTVFDIIESFLKNNDIPQNVKWIIDEQ